MLLTLQGCSKKQTGTDDGSTPPDREVSTEFIIERIDGGWAAWPGVSIASPPQGDPVIAEVMGRYLYLIEMQPDGTIAKQLVDRFCHWPDLEIDESGHRHLVYWRSRDEVIVYATDASGDWSREPIHRSLPDPPAGAIASAVIPELSARGP